MQEIRNVDADEKSFLCVFTYLRRDESTVYRVKFVEILNDIRIKLRQKWKIKWRR